MQGVFQVEVFEKLLPIWFENFIKSLEFMHSQVFLDFAASWTKNLSSLILLIFI